MVPVSIRTGGDGTGDTYQNRVSGLLASLATNEPDPVKRLRLVQQSMTAAKGSFAAIPAETLQDYTQFAPPAIAARAMRMYSRLRIADRMNPPFNLIDLQRARARGAALLGRRPRSSTSTRSRRSSTARA